MTYQSNVVLPCPPVICWVTENSIGPESSGLGGFAVSSTGLAWPSADLAIAYPLFLDRPEPFKRFWWGNAAAVSGNCDIGVYDTDFAKIWSSGSTARSGATTIQAVTPTPDPFTLGPGTFWLAMSHNGTASVWSSSPAERFVESLGVVEMASAFPLPSTFVPASFSSANMYAFGCATVTTL